MNKPVVSIVPSHGLRTAAVRWSVPPGHEGDQVYVYFSPAGVSGSWVLLTSTPVEGQTHWVDQDFVIRNKTTRGYYRVAMRAQDGTIIDSDPAGIYEALSRQELGMLRLKIKQEVFEARSRNGLPMWHCIPRMSGELSDNIDPDTDQAVGVECPAAQDQSYGQRYKGGFYLPVLTWVRARATRFIAGKDRADNLGSEDDRRLRCRFLPFPELRPEHMFVNPQTDDRYVVDTNITPYLLRGVAPLAWEAELILLPRNDPRYRFPTPDFSWEAFRNSRGHFHVVA